ncbi:hypothetical protein [Streptomyces liangshanensis]|uniref:hypothetical protein n=1 Tax=Streptomyces liangshanensis TaxID=2717324 RepID=UPI0036D7A582
MNRTLLYERWAAEAVRPGRLTVAVSAVHPVRGPVRCPAAPLVAAELERLGYPTGPGALVLGPPVLSPPRRGGAAGSGPAAVFAATYVDVDGTVAGVAVAGGPDLGADALEAAERSVREWAALFRTRRVLVAETAGTCAGTEGAAASCAAAARARETVAEFLRRGDTVVRIGSGGRGGGPGFGPGGGVGGGGAAGRGAGDGVGEGVGPGAGGGAGGGVGPGGGDGAGDGAGRLVAFDAGRPVGRQLARLRAVADPDRVSFVVRPCTPVDDVVPVVEALREAFPRLRGQHPDQWCYRSADRRDAVRALAAASDVVLLLGRPDPDLLTDPGPGPGPVAVRPVAAVRDVRRAWLAGSATVGVAAGPETPAGLLAGVTEALSGLGPYSVVRQESRRRVVVRPAGTGHLPHQGGRSAALQ